MSFPSIFAGGEGGSHAHVLGLTFLIVCLRGAVHKLKERIPLSRARGVDPHEYKPSALLFQDSQALDMLEVEKNAILGKELLFRNVWAGSSGLSEVVVHC